MNENNSPAQKPDAEPRPAAAPSGNLPPAADGTVAQLTAELHAAQNELETFCYSVSHDLRAPLRTIHGFAQILQEDHSQGLDAEALGLLSEIRTAAERAFQMINDLLALSRLSRQPLQAEGVDMTALAQSVIEELRAVCPERPLVLRIEPLPPAYGDRSMLRQIWAQLLSNALKFTRRCAAPEVWVGAWQQPGERVFFVKDNGVGFDMKYADRLFQMFQRLHPPTEFAGNGVGLATAQRLVRRHGGRLWAEARPHEGATFFFALPR